jgi:hypothetical protein
MSFGNPGPMPPLGWPIRHEDWYFIKDSFTTATVTVYPGEVVGCSVKNYNELAGLHDPSNTNDDPSEVVVLQYPEMAELLTKNGFIKL